MRRYGPSRCDILLAIGGLGARLTARSAAGGRGTGGVRRDRRRPVTGEPYAAAAAP